MKLQEEKKDFNVMWKQQRLHAQPKTVSVVDGIKTMEGEYVDNDLVFKFPIK